MVQRIKMTLQGYLVSVQLSPSERGGRGHSLLQLIPENVGVRAVLPDLQHVLDQADGAIVGFVQFTDDEEQIRAEGRRGRILPQQDRQVHGHRQGQQGVGEGLWGDSEQRREAQGARAL